METTELNDFWTEEFAPKKISDMVLSDQLADYFKNLVESKSRFNVLLAGSAGIGKTTIAKLLARELNASVLFVPCAIEGTVSTAQGKLKDFCDSSAFDGRPKMVILDELDSASGTQDNSFQKTLRNIISESPDTMFVGTCNYVEKVIEPVRSRLGVVSLGFTGKNLLRRIKHILDAKGIKYGKESLMKFVENVIKTNYPDIRRIISVLQASCSSGELVVSETQCKNFDRDFLSELLERVKTSKDLLSMREFYLKNRSKIDDYKVFGGAVFNAALDGGMVKKPETVLKMSDTIYQMNEVIDPEIQFFALLTILNEEIKDYEKE
jgi:DNA polymerase III, gamma/tau subunits